jgi:hypothetical protein
MGPITLTVPAIVAGIGALAYDISTNGKVMEMGRLAFACGPLALLTGLR